VVDSGGVEVEEMDGSSDVGRDVEMLRAVTIKSR
jgi:hypothetical protein